MRLLAVLVALALSACGACGKSGARDAAGGPSASSGGAEGTSSPRAAPPPEAGVVAVRDHAMWEHALDGGTEDLATLATHEGAMGLVEAAADADLKRTAIRAMAYARGWAELPYLAGVAEGEGDEDARLALDVVVDLAARPRRAEDLEDADELREGCDRLGALARDLKRPRDRRIPAIRALRMMPCRAGGPGTTGTEPLPTDLDAK